MPRRGWAEARAAGSFGGALVAFAGVLYPGGLGQSGQNSLYSDDDHFDRDGQQYHSHQSGHDDTHHVA